ncbi:beta-lactamase/transpeptidase-like protein [Mycena rosella]|uniref:Beta-lactamase/transpeptidase-like protein n=1 Tax=Mycena rosella TaxID=1033263 RepID=A0AAD7G6H0_MYCRO|nr:beta-lactamase/transpeptidase-like protein [Mycena rosella]
MDSFETALAAATDPVTRDSDLLGAIGLVVDNAGKFLYHHAAGQQSLSPATPALNPNSTITLGSAGKFITHIAALQCVERDKPKNLDGKWLTSLDEPLGELLPELASLEVIEPSDAALGFTLRPAAQSITLRHLLTHTSGLGGGDEPLVELWRASPAGIAHAAAAPNPIAKLFAHPLLFDPGAGFCYGGSIYFTGMLVARLTSQPLAEYVQANIFEPLGMSLSTLAPQTHPDPQLLGTLLPMVRRTPSGLVPVEGPTRDATVSVCDLGVLLSDLLGPASKILTPASADLLFSPQLAAAALSDLRGTKERENYAAPAGVGAGSDLTPQVNWTMAGLLVEGRDALPVSKMPPGTVTWNGMPNVVWAMNRERGVGMLFATQLVPVDDEKTVGIMMEFFKGAWATYGTPLQKYQG